MEKLTRAVILSLCLVLALSAAVVSAGASSEVPYQTYTYDKWGNATPAPNGYIPSRSIGGAQLGCGNFSSAADMFYSKALNKVFITDSGNNRIVVLSDNMELLQVLDSLTDENGETYTFNNPQGVFVLDNGTVYVCDTGNQDIVLCDLEGRLLSKLPKPESNLLPDNFNYQPTKMVVDQTGRMYIISKGTYQGLIYLDTDGSFIKFFGPNNVEMTFRRQILKIWKSILSDQAAASMQSFNPIEYGNVFMSDDGFIYATAAGSENGAALMTKLNPLGINRLPYKTSGSTSVIADVAVDENGITTMLDTNNGLIIQVDENGKNMFSFGGIGNQVGLFQKAVSVIEVNENLYVMDADKNTITEFRLTQFGKLVRTAITLYDEGLYRESIEPWQEVISHNANYLLAYTGLGKAYYQLKDYDTAMYYYRLANDRADYSEAFKASSLNRMRESFPLIVLGLVIAVAAIIFIKKYLDNREVPLGKAVESWLVRVTSGKKSGKE